MLSGLASKQEAILEKQGTDNPLVNMQQYHATLIKMTELSGYKDTQAFWSDPKNYKPPEPKPPEPTPYEVFAQAQADKVRADIDLDKQKFALEQEKMIRQDDLNRDKLDAELAMKKDELENKYQTTIDQTEIRGILDADRERARQQTLQEQQALQQQQMGAPPMPPVDMNPQQMGPPMEPIPN